MSRYFWLMGLLEGTEELATKACLSIAVSVRDLGDGFDCAHWVTFFRP